MQLFSQLSKLQGTTSYFDKKYGKSRSQIWHCVVVGSHNDTQSNFCKKYSYNLCLTFHSSFTTNFTVFNVYSTASILESLSFSTLKYNKILVCIIIRYITLVDWKIRHFSRNVLWVWPNFVILGHLIMQ